MSIFKYDAFYGGYDTFAVSKEKYSKEEAIHLAKNFFYHLEKPYHLAIGNAFVWHGFGVNGYRKRIFGWWIKYHEQKCSCPCWVFHYTYNIDDDFDETYEYIEVGGNDGKN